MKSFVKFPAVVSEMADDETKIDVPVSPKANIQELLKGDDDPLFVTVEALNASVSKNFRRYTPELVAEIASQVNEKLPDGYLGHLTESERTTKTPKAQTIWLGASVKDVGGKSRMFVKGYILPYAKELKEYLRKAKAVGKKVEVSIFGEAKQVWNSVIKAYDLFNFDLESIDWARSGSQGIDSTGAFNLTSEMEDNIMEREDIIKDLKLEEIESLNKDLVKEMKDKVISEYKVKNPDPEPKPEPDEVGVVSEMKEQFGVKENDELKSKVSEMAAENKKLVDVYLDKELSEKVESPAARKIIRKMIVAEMVDTNTKEVDESIRKVLDSEEAKALISEVKSISSISPKNDNRDPNDTRSYTVIK